MKAMLYVLCALAALPAFSGHAQTQNRTRQLTLEANSQTSQKRIALVIGNAAYTNAKPLDNPANDAADMAATLETLGFEVLSGTNQNKRQLETLIRRFGTRLAVTKGTGLFYYAGHGLQVNGENYLVPVDAEIPEADEVQYQAVPMNLVLSKMNSAGNDLNIVILDACRNNPFARSWRGFRDTGEADGLARITPPQGTIVLYATQPGSVASDGTGRNGLFTESLLRQIKRPNVELDQMVKNLTRDVSERSKRKQFPWREGSSTGDFYFVASAMAAATTKPANNQTPAEVVEPNFGNTANAADIEREAFVDIQNSADAGEIRAVLEECPASKYAAAARIKLDRLTWGAIKNSKDKAKIQSYLTEFPNGQYAAAARIELRKLTRPAAVEPLPSPTPRRARNDISTAAAATTAGSNVVLNYFKAANGKYGYKDADGTIIIAPTYDDAWSFSGGLAEVKQGGKYGFIDKTGEVVIPIKYDLAFSFKEGLALVKQGGKYGFVDTTGKVVIPLQYDDAEPFREDLAAVKQGSKYGFIDKTGEIVIPLKYDEAAFFREGLAHVKQGGKHGFIDQTGKVVVPIQYDYAYSFYEGLGEVGLDGKRGFVDKTGKVVIPPQYDFALFFTEGLVAVRRDGKYGYIDKTGKVVVPLQYDDANLFRNGRAQVKLGDREFYIDKNGDVIPATKKGAKRAPESPRP
ncbi:MAG TPA: WG repeat-containing protein [Pyrinomonadaceae bacterium]|nr:WG repeat-containing protein [Pyrinomonadaceae bacterium]